MASITDEAAEAQREQGMGHTAHEQLGRFKQAGACSLLLPPLSTPSPSQSHAAQRGREGPGGCSLPTAWSCRVRVRKVDWMAWCPETQHQFVSGDE